MVRQVCCTGASKSKVLLAKRGPGRRGRHLLRRLRRETRAPAWERAVDANRAVPLAGSDHGKSLWSNEVTLPPLKGITRCERDGSRGPTLEIG